MLRAGIGLSEVRRKAQAIYDDEGQPSLLLLVRLADRNLAEVDRLLTENDLQSYAIDNLYDDPDAGAVLSSAEFLPIRRKFPPRSRI